MPLPPHFQKKQFEEKTEKIEEEEELENQQKKSDDDLQDQEKFGMNKKNKKDEQNLNANPWGLFIKTKKKANDPQELDDYGSSSSSNYTSSISFSQDFKLFCGQIDQIKDQYWDIAITHKYQLKKQTNQGEYILRHIQQQQQTNEYFCSRIFLQQVPEDMSRMFDEFTKKCELRQKNDINHVEAQEQDFLWLRIYIGDIVIQKMKRGTTIQNSNGQQKPIVVKMNTHRSQLVKEKEALKGEDTLTFDYMQFINNLPFVMFKKFRTNNKKILGFDESYLPPFRLYPLPEEITLDSDQAQKQRDFKNKSITQSVNFNYDEITEFTIIDLQHATTNLKICALYEKGKAIDKESKNFNVIEIDIKYEHDGKKTSHELFQGYLEKTLADPQYIELVATCGKSLGTGFGKKMCDVFSHYQFGLENKELEHIQVGNVINVREFNEAFVFDKQKLVFDLNLYMEIIKENDQFKQQYSDHSFAYWQGQGTIKCVALRQLIKDKIPLPKKKTVKHIDVKRQKESFNYTFNSGKDYKQIRIKEFFQLHPFFFKDVPNKKYTQIPAYNTQIKNPNSIRPDDGIKCCTKNEDGYYPQYLICSQYQFQGCPLLTMEFTEKRKQYIVQIQVGYVMGLIMLGYHPIKEMKHMEQKKHIKKDKHFTSLTNLDDYFKQGEEQIIGKLTFCYIEDQEKLDYWPLNEQGLINEGYLSWGEFYSIAQMGLLNSPETNQVPGKENYKRKYGFANRGLINAILFDFSH